MPLHLVGLVPVVLGLAEGILEGSPALVLAVIPEYLLLFLEQNAFVEVDLVNLLDKFVLRTYPALLVPLQSLRQLTYRFVSPFHPWPLLFDPFYFVVNVAVVVENVLDVVEL